MPYYLLKKIEKVKNNKNNKKQILFPGTIYSRNGDSNTPKDQVASEQEIIDLWKYRFSINLTPLERFNIYIKDFKNWIKNGDNSYYYAQHPEFTITSDKNTREYNEPWTKIMPNKSCRSCDFYLKYYETTLKTFHVAMPDGYRYYISIPDFTFVEYNHNSNSYPYITQYVNPELKTNMYFYKIKNSMSYYLDFILSNKTRDKFYNIQSSNRLHGISIYDNVEDAEKSSINHFWNYLNGTPKIVNSLIPPEKV